MHLARLREGMVDAGVEVEFVDLSGGGQRQAGVRQGTWRTLALWLFPRERRIIHIHAIPYWAFPLAALLRLRHVVILSLHNERFADEVLALPRPLCSIVRWCYARLSCLVLDSDHCVPHVERLDLRPRPVVHVIPEFIPPRTLPPIQDREILALRSRVRHLIGSNAWRIMFHHGVDLYGIDLIIEAVTKLRSRGIDAGVAFLLPAIGEPEWYDALRRRIVDEGLDGYFLFVHTPVEEASSLWRLCDVVVRATNTDGNSLTILESLAVGTPVVASDCVPRPSGTRTFRTRDANDLASTLGEVLEFPPTRVPMQGESAVAGNLGKFLSLYERLDQAGQK